MPADGLIDNFSARSKLKDALLSGVKHTAMSFEEENELQRSQGRPLLRASGGHAADGWEGRRPCAGSGRVTQPGSGIPGTAPGPKPPSKASQQAATVAHGLTDWQLLLCTYKGNWE